jgi:hypothetical protein
MITYDPSSDSMSTPIEAVQETEEKPKGPPTGLLKTIPEKNVDESQMAEFATPIEEVMPGPGQMMQDEMMGPAMPTSGNKKTERRQESDKKKSKNPFGLTDEQYMAALAGVAAVVAFSRPVQGKLSTMVPKFFVEGTNDMSVTGMAVSALVAAIVFYFAKQFLADKA